MSHFVSNKLKKIELGDGEYVEIPTDMSFEDSRYLGTIKVTFSDEFDQTIQMLLKFIKNWNLKDEDGKEVELISENIERLKMPTLVKIQEEILAIMGMEGKKKPEKESVS